MFTVMVKNYRARPLLELSAGKVKMRHDEITILPQIHFYDLKHILKLAPKQ